MSVSIFQTIIPAYELQWLTQNLNGTTLYIINSSYSLLECFEKIIGTIQYQTPAVIFKEMCFLINIVEANENINSEVNVKVLQYAIKKSLRYSINSIESTNLYGGCEDQFDQIKNEEEKHLALQVFSLLPSDNLFNNNIILSSDRFIETYEGKYGTINVAIEFQLNNKVSNDIEIIGFITEAKNWLQNIFFNKLLNKFIK